MDSEDKGLLFVTRSYCPDMREFFAKLLFCKPDSVDNVGLHIPVGMINVIVYYAFAYLALAFSLGFFFYELRQSHLTNDKGYDDIQGWLWGLAIMAVIILLWRLRHG